MGDHLNSVAITQKFYNGLPCICHHYMDLLDFTRSHQPGIRVDYETVQDELKKLKQWRPFIEAIQEASKSKAFTAMMTTAVLPISVPVTRRYVLVPATDEIVTFATSADKPEAQR